MEARWNAADCLILLSGGLCALFGCAILTDGGANVSAPCPPVPPHPLPRRGEGICAFHPGHPLRMSLRSIRVPLRFAKGTASYSMLAIPELVLGVVPVFGGPVFYGSGDF